MPARGKGEGGRFGLGWVGSTRCVGLFNEGCTWYLPLVVAVVAAVVVVVPSYPLLSLSHYSIQFKTNLLAVNSNTGNAALPGKNWIIYI